MSVPYSPPKSPAPRSTRVLSRAERAQGGIWGLLLGDAVGVPYEFHRPESLPPLDELDLTPPPGFHRAHSGTPVGTWSDDGAHALALLDSLLTHRGLNLRDLGDRLVAWYERGQYAVGGRVFDVGIQTTAALRALSSGADPETAGPAAERSNGNGSLMRVLPLALWHRGDDVALVHDAHRQSLVTHGHRRSQICCAWYCLWARAELAGEPEAPQRALARLRAIYAARWPEHGAELEATLTPDSPPPPRGTGYVVDCLYSAMWACEGEDARAVIRRAISLGHDTDTTACVAGGIAGVRWGLEGLPSDWLGRLRGRELVEPLIDRLLAL